MTKNTFNSSQDNMTYLICILSWGVLCKESFMVKDMETIVQLAKHRGFVFPGSDIYGGLSNTWDYGPLGVELKNNIKKHGGKIYYSITL